MLEAIRLIRRELDGPHNVPLIGFGGAPFTLASYAIEGGHSQNFALTEGTDVLEPAGVAPAVRHAGHDHGRIHEGASRSGRAGDSDFRFVGRRAAARPTTASSCCRTRAQSSTRSRGTGVPTIHFGTGTANILQDLNEAGGDVIGADWRIPLDEAWERIGHDRAIQGNLDPTLLLAPLDRMLTAADDVLERAGGRPGHIFNLGHGILPSTPVDHVQALAQHVHRYRLAHA